jgi:hypothetical protein
MCKQSMKINIQSCTLIWEHFKKVILDWSTMERPKAIDVEEFFEAVDPETLGFFIKSYLGQQDEIEESTLNFTDIADIIQQRGRLVDLGWNNSVKTSVDNVYTRRKIEKKYGHENLQNIFTLLNEKMPSIPEVDNELEKRQIGKLRTELLRAIMNGETTAKEATQRLPELEGFFDDLKDKVTFLQNSQERKLLICGKIVSKINEIVYLCLLEVPGLATYRIQNLTSKLTCESLPSNHLAHISPSTDWVEVLKLLFSPEVDKKRGELAELVNSMFDGSEIFSMEPDELNLIYNSKLDIELSARINAEILLGCNTWYQRPHTGQKAEEVVIRYTLGLINSLLRIAGIEFGGIRFPRQGPTPRDPDDPLNDEDIFHRPGHSSGGRYGSQFYNRP